MRSGHPRAVDFGPTADAEEGEFEETYREHVVFLWRSLRRLGVPDEALEDATHEVFVVAHRRWTDWDRHSRITTWLYGIARGVARNVIRGRCRSDRKLAAVHGEPPRVASRFDDPGRHVEMSEAADLLETFVGQLDPAKREVFLLCEVEGLSAADAARCLDLNPNTVSTRLRRARRRFDAFVEGLDVRSA